MIKVYVCIKGADNVKHFQEMVISRLISHVKKQLLVYNTIRHDCIKYRINNKSKRGDYRGKHFLSCITTAEANLVTFCES